MKFAKFLLALNVLVITLPAQAHYLWLEPVDGAAHLCFGEYENALREKTGDRLDTIAMPETQTRVADGKWVPVSTQRKADHIAVQAPANQPLIAQEVSMKVKDLRKNNIGIVKPMYYTRFATDNSENPSSLALDIQPLGDNKVKVSLRGKPLAKTRLTVFAPNQWLREYETNEAGEVSVHTPWPGLYVADVAYVEPVKGEYRGEAYEGIRHVGTLSFVR